MINKVSLMGKLTMMPEVKAWSSGDEYAEFRMVTSEKWTDKSGDEKERQDYHNIKVTEPHSVNFCKRLQKGNIIYLEGKIETRQYKTKEGDTKYVTEILIKPFQGKIIGISKGDAQEDDTTPGETASEDWGSLLGV